MNIRYLFFLSVFFVPLKLIAGNLITTLNDDLPKSIKQNILTYLGGSPTQDEERIVYIYSAKRKTQNALQALGYYLSDVNTETIKDLSKDVWTLKIQVTLNKPTIVDSVSITIVGDAQNDPQFEALLNLQRLKTGDILHHGTYEQVKSELLALGLQRGYFDQKLVNTRIAIHQSYHSAGISINYQSGKRYRFGKIEFGDVGIEPDVINSLIPFNRGDFYTVSQLQFFQNQLEQTNYFGNAVITPNKEASKDNYLPIDVSLEKAKSHFFNIGLEFATDTGVRTSLGWRTPLVNRYGHRQETTLEYSTVDPQGRFSYSIPLSHPLNDVLQFQLLLKSDKFGDIDSKYWASQLGRMRTENNWTRQTYIRYLNENWDIDGLSNNVEYILPGVTWSQSKRRGPPLDPSSGYNQYYNIEATHIVLGAKTNFIRFNGRWKYIITPLPKHRLVAKAEVGITQISQSHYADLAPSLRFFSGGDQSIRGYAYQSVGPVTTFMQGEKIGENREVGGTHLLTASLEYQYYFREQWRGALFIDGGSVTNHAQLDPTYGIGTGIHYISPVGAIRLDFGYSVSEESPSWRIHFTLGAEL